MTDDDLLGRMATGDEEAFATLYRRHQGGIYRFALHMSGSAGLAEDVTQEVFLVLIRDSAGYDPARGSLAAYLYGTARHIMLRSLSRERLHVPVDGAEAAAPGDILKDVTRRETVESVRQAVLSLPPHYREVVVLCDLQELDYAKAALVLECAVGTVRSRLHRARSLLLEKLRRGVAHELSGV